MLREQRHVASRELLLHRKPSRRQPVRQQLVAPRVVAVVMAMLVVVVGTVGAALGGRVATRRGG